MKQRFKAAEYRAGIDGVQVRVRKESAVCAAFTVLLSTVLAAGCGGSGSAGVPGQTRSVADIISDASLSPAGRAALEPAMIPTGTGPAPVLVSSSDTAPNAGHPNGQLLLNISESGIGAAVIALVGLTGTVGYFQAPDYSPNPPSFERAFAPTAYTPGQPVHVTIGVQSGFTAFLSAVEAPPRGWAVSNISAGGQFNASGGDISWAFSGALPGSLTYDVTPPIDAAVPFGFLGVGGGGPVSPIPEAAGSLGPIDGEQVLAPDVRAADRGGTRSLALSAPGIAGGKGLARRNLPHRAPPPPFDTLTLDPKMPIDAFSADLTLVVANGAGLSLPTTIHVKNGIASAGA